MKSQENIDANREEMDLDAICAERLSRLGQGSVILATDLLKDPNFEGALILVCQHSAEGSYGLIINRPSHMPVSEMFDGFFGVDARRRVYIGGPVQQESLQIIEVTDAPAVDAFQVATGVYMGGQWDDVNAILGDERPQLRLFLGYSGWSAYQLEHEILNGAWHVFNVDLRSFLSGSEEGWRAPSSEVALLLNRLQNPQ